MDLHLHPHRVALVTSGLALALLSGCVIAPARHPHGPYAPPPQAQSLMDTLRSCSWEVAASIPLEAAGYRASALVCQRGTEAAP